MTEVTKKVVVDKAVEADRKKLAEIQAEFKKKLKEIVKKFK